MVAVGRSDSLRGCRLVFVVGFKKSTEAGTTMPSRIHLDADHDDSNTIYNLYLDSTLNWLDSGDSTDIPTYLGQLGKKIKN